MIEKTDCRSRGSRRRRRVFHETPRHALARPRLVMTQQLLHRTILSLSHACQTICHHIPEPDGPAAGDFYKDVRVSLTPVRFLFSFYECKLYLNSARLDRSETEIKAPERDTLFIVNNIGMARIVPTRSDIFFLKSSRTMRSMTPCGYHIRFVPQQILSEDKTFIFYFQSIFLVLSNHLIDFEYVNLSVIRVFSVHSVIKLTVSRNVVLI